MTDQSLPNPAGTPDPWAVIAAELRRIADDLAKLIGQPAPATFEINTQPYSGSRYGGQGGDAATIAATDAVANALLGHPAETRVMGDGSYQHTTYGRRGPLRVAVYQGVEFGEKPSDDE